MKVNVLIQARMGSTRLPGKVMFDLAGKSVLGRVVERSLACRGVNEVVIATSTLSQDDVLEEEADRLGARCFRGSETDVLERFYLAAKKYPADAYFRITSDCPLIDPKLMEQVLEVWRHESPGAVDYVSTFVDRTYPRGLDTELFSFGALERAYREAKDPYEREHVTPYVYLHPDRFRLRSVRQDLDQSFHRWTLDTPEDYELLSEIYSSLQQGHEIFTTEDVLALFEKRPELIHLNSHIRQK